MRQNHRQEIESATSRHKLSYPKLVAVFQVQQPQQRVDRDRRAAQPAVEQRPPRRDEAVVVQVGVDLGQLSR
jgi:hypothetical protein